MQDRTKRIMLVVATLVWLQALVWFSVLLAADAVFSRSDLHCPINRDESTYGEASWGWSPPGLRCTFGPELTGTGEARVDGPSELRSVAIVAVLVAGVSLAYAQRSLGRTPGTDGRQPQT